MTTSHRITLPSEKQSGAHLSKTTIAYFQARNKHRAYDFVISEFIKSGMSQAELARRLGKGNDQVCRWLGAPGNWTLDTLSDLLLGILGGEPEYSVSLPLDKPKRSKSSVPKWATKAVPKDGRFAITTVNNPKGLYLLQIQGPKPSATFDDNKNKRVLELSNV